jgi:hypothetical protein
MGYIRDDAERMNLAAMSSRGDLSSTKHVLASTDSSHAEFLVYAPSGGKFTVNLSEVSGMIAVEWMNAATGDKSHGASVSGGASTTFTPPFSDDAVLYLRRIASGGGQN